MNPLSIRVSADNQSFLETMVGRGKSKTEIINDALDFLRKAQLRSELTAMATDDVDEDASFANMSMEDYLTLLDDAV